MDSAVIDVTDGIVKLPPLWKQEKKIRISSAKRFSKKLNFVEQLQESVEQDNRGEYATKAEVEGVFSFWEKHFAAKICK